METLSTTSRHHALLFLPAPPRGSSADAVEAWTEAKQHAEGKVGNTGGSKKVHETLWQFDLETGLAALSKSIAHAAENEVPYKVLLLESAPIWIDGG